MTRTSDPDSRFTILLEDGFGTPIDRVRVADGDEQILVRELDAGVYLIGIRSPSKLD
ncbi:MAG: hypothetical protein IPK00_10495 [Deltaproteobacteria bacterium]|nr:hypothetical protein [Deltaproteobacteria bacterium]